MTLIIGVKCSDGVVIGSDGVATYALPFSQQQTIKQASSRKLALIGENVIFGVSGPVGLAQSYQHELQTVIATTNGRANWRTVLDARQKITAALWKHAKPLYDNAEVVSRSGVGQPAVMECLHSSIIAFPVGDYSSLIQFTAQCAPEEATNSLPFISIGSGQPAADPFLAFIRRVFWPDRPPTVNEAVLSTIWALKYSIHAQPGGIGDPLQVATLEKDSNVWKARELTPDEINLHVQAIGAMESEMKLSVEKSFTATANAIPA